MERLLVIWCPRLLEEREAGREARAFLRVVESAAAFSPVAAPVRLGVCAVPTRGPSRYFGGDRRLAQLVCHAMVEVEEAGIGIADGLFAAVLAARAAKAAPVVVSPGESPAFLAPWPVETLERPELADLLRRLGIDTLGGFAALPPRHVLGRLGTEGAICHEVARGTRGELPGYRLVPRRQAPRSGGGEQPGAVRQAGFWGGAAAAEARAAVVLARLEQLVGPEGLVVGRLQGGRGPVDRARLVPWVGRRSAPGAPGGPGPEPWPGRLPPPAPAVVLDQKLPATVLDADGAELGVSAAGLPSAAPQKLSVAGGPWQAVVAWAGPWPTDERWWSGRGRRRRARMQLVAEAGMAYLMVRQDAGWWVEGAYD